MEFIELHPAAVFSDEQLISCCVCVVFSSLHYNLLQLRSIIRLLCESGCPQHVSTSCACSVSCTTVTQYLLHTTCYKLYFDLCESDYGA